MLGIVASSYAGGGATEFISSSSAYGEAILSITTPKPANTQEGDIIVLMLITAGTDPVSAIPSGFSQIAFKYNSLENLRVFGYKKLATASEPSSYTTTTASNNTGTQQLSAFTVRGGDVDGVIGTTYTSGNWTGGGTGTEGYPGANVLGGSFVARSDIGVGTDLRNVPGDNVPPNATLTYHTPNTNMVHYTQPVVGGYLPFHLISPLEGLCGASSLTIVVPPA